jgi:hypothetical protein
MRTTLVIDDDLYREIKSMAALQGETVTSQLEPAARKPSLPRSYGTGGEAVGVDLTDNKSLRAILELDGHQS